MKHLLRGFMEMSNICVSVCLMLLSRCEDCWTFFAAVVALSSQYLTCIAIIFCSMPTYYIPFKILISLRVWSQHLDKLADSLGFSLGSCGYVTIGPPTHLILISHLFHTQYTYIVLRHVTIRMQTPNLIMIGLKSKFLTCIVLQVMIRTPHPFHTHSRSLSPYKYIVFQHLLL